MNIDNLIWYIATLMVLCRHVMSEVSSFADIRALDKSVTFTKNYQQTTLLTCHMFCTFENCHAPSYDDTTKVCTLTGKIDVTVTSWQNGRFVRSYGIHKKFTNLEKDLGATMECLDTDGDPSKALNGQLHNFYITSKLDGWCTVDLKAVNLLIEVKCRSDGYKDAPVTVSFDDGTNFTGTLGARTYVPADKIVISRYIKIQLNAVGSGYTSIKMYYFTIQTTTALN